uniref:Uncharacterized protein n=1 Tax=Anguilla anguilla TaxID=7936 RepID=A0A0E9Q8B2_ANGAN
MCMPVYVQRFYLFIIQTSRNNKT